MNVHSCETDIPLAVHPVLDCINSRAPGQEVDTVYSGGGKHPIIVALQCLLPRMPLTRLLGETGSPGNRSVTSPTRYAGWG